MKISRRYDRDVESLTICWTGSLGGTLSLNEPLLFVFAATLLLPQHIWRRRGAINSAAQVTTDICRIATPRNKFRSRLLAQREKVNGGEKSLLNEFYGTIRRTSIQKL